MLRSLPAQPNAGAGAPSPGSPSAGRAKPGAAPAADGALAWEKQRSTVLLQLQRHNGRLQQELGELRRALAQHDQQAARAREQHEQDLAAAQVGAQGQASTGRIRMMVDPALAARRRCTTPAPRFVAAPQGQVGIKLHLQQAAAATAFCGFKQQALKQRVLAAWLRHGRQRRKLAWAEAHWRRRALVAAFYEWQFAAARQRWAGMAVLAACLQQACSGGSLCRPAARPHHRTAPWPPSCPARALATAGQRGC